MPDPRDGAFCKPTSQMRRKKGLGFGIPLIEGRFAAGIFKPAGS
ncbi:MAG: hypothetical protein ACM3ON_12635 [Chloroflexota bacterium]